MEPIVIFTRVRLCDKPVLKEAKNKTQFYVFTIQSEGSKYACKLFEDSECFEKIASLHLEGGDYLDLQCTMKKMIQKIKMPATSEDGEPCEVLVPHEVTHFKVKNLDFAIPVEFKKTSKKNQDRNSKSVNPMTDLSGFED